MKILVTGGAGYVGSVLIPELVRDGHSVKCLDRFFFGSQYLSGNEFKGKIELLKDDIRWFEPKILKDVDVVLDLAALSNDPVGELDPEKTFQINHLGRNRVANLSKKSGVKKYILASSASIYGQQDGIVNEESNVNPLTAYSKANRKAEADVLPLNDDNFTVTVLRFSSIYGYSPRMRFDLAVNSMVLDLYKTGKIVVMGKGNRRPFLHVKDAVKAYQMFLVASKEKIEGHIFNVGSDVQNYEIGKLSEEVAKSIGIDYSLELRDTHDNRSYTASFEKIKKIIGFVTQHTVKDGAIEIYEALRTGKLDDSIKTRTVEWYKQLQSDKKLGQEVSLNGIIL